MCIRDSFQVAFKGWYWRSSSRSVYHLRSANILYYIQLPTSMPLWRKNLPWISLLIDCRILSSNISRVSVSWYELVQDKRWKFPQPRMSLAPFIRMLRVHTTYLLSCWLPWTVEEGDTAGFVSGPEVVALVAQTCPHPPQAIEKAWIVRLFRRTFFFLIFLWTKQSQVLQGMSVKRFTQTFKDWPAEHEC